MKRPPAVVTDLEEVAPTTKRHRVVTPSTSLECLPGAIKAAGGGSGGASLALGSSEPASTAEGGQAGTVSPRVGGPGAAGPAAGGSAAQEERRERSEAEGSSSGRGGGGPAAAQGTLESLVTAARGRAVGSAVVAKTGRWTKREDLVLRQTVSRLGEQSKDWKRISMAAFNGARSEVQCFERWEKVLKLGLVKGPWTPEEDEIVRRAVEDASRNNGGNSDLVNWAEIAKLLPGRLTKQVRERWQNHLNPALVKSPWTEEEDYLLVSLQAVLGNRWNEIARAFQGRSENAIKNRWNSKQRRTLLDAQAVPGLAKQKPDLKSILPAAKNVCRSVNFHKALVKASGNDPEINEAASILVNKVSRSVAVQ